MPAPSQRRSLPGTARPPVPGASLVGPVERKERVAVTLLLRVRHDAPHHPDLADWQQLSPGQRRFLSADEYMRDYGSTDEDLGVVLDYLQSQGLQILASSAGRRRLVAEGDVTQVNRAFGIELNWYRAPHPGSDRPVPGPGGTHAGPPRRREELLYRGFDGAVSLPGAVADVVDAVIGLDNRQLGQAMATGTGDPPSANYLSPVAVAQMYKFPNTGAAGQTIGVFEDAAAGAAYLHSDIHSFISSLPAGYHTQPNLIDIGVTVGATTYSNNGGLVTSSPSGAVLECGGDVSIAAAISQGANINVYFTDTSEAGWEAFFDRAIFPLAGDFPPSVLTASWAFSLQDDVGTIGSPATPGTTANVLSGKLSSAALRGITVFMAIGDWGSADLVLDGRCHVPYPNGDPGVTACGGTIVGNVHSLWFEEFTWSEAGTASPFQNFPYVATGGGVSDTFPVPSYQTTASVLPISNNDGNSRRGVPDVAGMVAMDGFFFGGFGGPGAYPSFGTSWVAPFYAGLVAVVNKFLGRNSGFLNPTLYTHGPSICRDVRFGDDDAGNGPVPPDAPVYHAGPGWDACTGWGSINGTRLRAALAPAPIIVTAIPGDGQFVDTCQGSFADQILTVNNTGFSPLFIGDITSSSADFLVPTISSYPLVVGPDESLDLVLRFQPTAPGGHVATITLYSNDLLGPHTVPVSGTSPSGKLVVTGSTCFGGVKACCCAERTIQICNIGDCQLRVTSVAFRHPSRHWRLVRDPFPAVLRPGSSLDLVIQYRATERVPHSCDLVIESDDPTRPVEIIEVEAYTIWPGSSCRTCCGCGRGTCERPHCEPSSCPDCGDGCREDDEMG
jgi:subtilase family serine protease